MDDTGGSDRFQEKFQKLLEAAIDERESGDALKSIELFLKILLLQGLKLEDRLLVRNHLGLAYFHAGEKHYADAVSTFAHVDDITRGAGSYFGYRAVALRNLARPQFIGYGISNTGESDEYISDARKIAKRLARKDLVWFTHGMVSLRIYEGYIDSDTRKLFWEEVKEWFTLAQKENRRDKLVWLLGIFADFVRLYLAGLSVPALKMAKWFAHKNNLVRREEQIQKALNEVTKK